MNHSYGATACESSLSNQCATRHEKGRYVRDPPTVLGSNAPPDAEHRPAFAPHVPPLMGPLEGLKSVYPQYAALKASNKGNEVILRGSDLYAPAPLVVPDPTVMRYGRIVAVRPVNFLEGLKYGSIWTDNSPSCSSAGTSRRHAPRDGVSWSSPYKIPQARATILLCESANGRTVRKHQYHNLAMLEEDQRHRPSVQVLRHYDPGRHGYMDEDQNWHQPRLMTRMTGFDHLIFRPLEYYAHVVEPEPFKTSGPFAPTVPSAYNRLIEVEPTGEGLFVAHNPPARKVRNGLPSDTYPVLAREPPGLAPDYRPYEPSTLRLHVPAKPYGLPANMLQEPLPHRASITNHQPSQQPMYGLATHRCQGIKRTGPELRMENTACSNVQGVHAHVQQPQDQSVPAIRPMLNNVDKKTQARFAESGKLQAVQRAPPKPYSDHDKTKTANECHESCDLGPIAPLERMPFAELVNQSAWFAEHAWRDAHRVLNDRCEVLAAEDSEEVEPSIEDASGGAVWSSNPETGEAELGPDLKIKHEPEPSCSPLRQRVKGPRQETHRSK